MIAAIGVMIGAYILTRMLQCLVGPHAKGEAPAVQVCAVVTMAVTGIAIVILWFGPGPTLPTR